MVRWPSRHRSRPTGVHRRNPGIGQHGTTPWPHGHWNPTTFGADLRRTGMVVPTVRDGSIDRDAFVACVRQVPVPCLSPDGIVTMDKLSSHKAPHRMRGDRGGWRHPAFPPAPGLLPGHAAQTDFNPIEQGFSRLKADRHKAAGCILHGLSSAIARISNYFVNAGYDAG